MASVSWVRSPSYHFDTWCGGVGGYMELCHCLSQSTVEHFILEHAAGPQSSSDVLTNRMMIQLSSWDHASSLCSLFPASSQARQHSLLSKDCSIQSNWKTGPTGRASYPAWVPQTTTDSCAVLQAPSADHIQP